MNNTQAQQQQKIIKMNSAPLGGLLAELAVPAVISMLVTSLYNMADTYFVGSISNAATGAVSVSLSLMSVIQAIGFFFGHGSGNHISKMMGSGNVPSAKKMAGFGFLLSLLFGALLSVGGLLFTEELALFLGSTETILPHAVSYMRYILIGAPFMCASFTLNNQLRFQGNPFFGMVGIGVGAVLNVALDPLLIFGFGMGVAGAALATLISQAISFLILLAGCLSKKSIGFSMRIFSLDKSYPLWLCKGGLPSLFRQGFMAISVIALNKACSVAGDALSIDAAIAAMGVVSKIMGFAFSVIIGIGQGFQPICGFNYGAGNYDRVKKAYWMCVKLSTGLLIVMCLLGLMFAEPLVGLFRDDALVITLGAKVMRLQCAAFILAGFTTMSNMMLQNIGKVFRASFLAVARQGIFFVPFVTLLPLFMGIDGVLWAQPLADVSAFVCSLAMHLPVLGSLEKNK